MPAYYHNETLFSEIYLEEITRQAENADVLASLKVLGEYREYADTHNLKAWKESYVHEVLSALGFFAQSGCDRLTFLFPMGSSGATNPLSLCYVVYQMKTWTTQPLAVTGLKRLSGRCEKITFSGVC